MEESQKWLQKYLIVALHAEEQEGILENMIFAESVLERKQMLENSQE
jgi:hypothetical protein